jgi:hypothetical protein
MTQQFTTTTDQHLQDMQLWKWLFLLLYTIPVIKKWNYIIAD